MPRRKDSFARALADAEKRLARAKAERAIAITAIVALDEEIPRLQNVIASLGGKVVTANVEDTVVTGEHRAETSAALPMTPEQVKKLAEQATGKIRGGSIPYGGVKPPAPPVSEEEMLPNPEGEEIID